MRSRIVEVSFFVRPAPKFARGDVHWAVRQGVHDVPPAGPACWPFGQFKAANIRDEVRLPLVPARAYGTKLALPAEVALVAKPILEHERVVEDEALVVRQVQIQGHVAAGCQARRLAAAAVEQLVPGIEGNPEHGPGAPFERVAGATGQLDARGATPTENV